MEKFFKNISKIIGKGFSSENSSSFEIKIQSENREYLDEDNTIKEYEEEQIDQSIICEEKTLLNGKIGIEGELLISKTKNIDLNVDLNGSLLISGNQKDNYEINKMGELIFNY